MLLAEYRWAKDTAPCAEFVWPPGDYVRCGLVCCTRCGIPAQFHERAALPASTEPPPERGTNP